MVRSRCALVTMGLILACSWSRLSQAEPSSRGIEVAIRPSGVFVVAGKGKLEGFDVEILRSFLDWHRERAGEDLDWRPVSVDTVSGLLGRARRGECHLAVGSVTITKERERFVDFSMPYLPLRSVLIAPSKTLAPGRVEEILSGKRVGAIMGTTNAARVHELATRVTELEAATEFRGNEELFDALLGASATLDAAVTDIIHFWQLSRRHDVVLVELLGPQQGLGFVFPEGSPLKSEVDGFLDQFMDTSTYFNLVERYFGSEAAKVVKFARENASP